MATRPGRVRGNNSVGESWLEEWGPQTGLGRGQEERASATGRVVEFSSQTCLIAKKLILPAGGTVRQNERKVTRRWPRAAGGGGGGEGSPASPTRWCEIARGGVCHLQSVFPPLKGAGVAVRSWQVLSGASLEFF